MISVHDLQQGQKVDSQDVNGDWHTATIQSVKRKVKKPYAIITWDQYPAAPPDKVYESAGKIRARKGRAFRKDEQLRRRGLHVGRNADGTYEVERIIAEKNLKGRRHYKLRWRGWEARWDQWRPERCVADDLIAAWRKEQRSGATVKKTIGKKRPAYVLSLPKDGIPAGQGSLPRPGCSRSGAAASCTLASCAARATPPGSGGSARPSLRAPRAAHARLRRAR